MTTPASTVLYPLGSMGWIPSGYSQTACYAFFRGDNLIIIDAGSGLARLMDLRQTLFNESWLRLKQVRIFLTHYHLDHCAGLFWIRGIFGDLPVTIYAPGPDIYGRPAKDILDDLFRKPYSPKRLEEFGPDIRIEDLSLSGLTIDTAPSPLKILVRKNTLHSDPSVSLRFGDLFTFITDTPAEDDLVEFARGSKVLLHESWYDSSRDYKGESDPLDRHNSAPHAGSFGAGLVSKRAGIDRLYLIHHNPERLRSEIDEDARKVSEKLGIDCRAVWDLMEIDI